MYNCNVNYLFGNIPEEISPIKIFDEDVTAFLNELSKKIFSSQYFRDYPDLATLAFYCRYSNIQNIKSRIMNINNKIGRGLCFHITPSNIPINFAFSYIFSLLCGNINIVRLPSKKYEQSVIFCELLSSIIGHYPWIKNNTIFVEYPRDDICNQKFSLLSDCRMIWGGDSTVSLFKSYKTKPRCVDVYFSDRHSICILDSSAINLLNESELNNLVVKFYNDTYLMDQNACSSPKIIFWIDDDYLARDRFYAALNKYVEYSYDLKSIIAIDKYVKVCEDAIEDNINNIFYYSNSLIIARLHSSSLLLDNIGGLFYEYIIDEYSELLPFITDKYQTITYYGIDPSELLQYLIKNNIHGVDRIVKIGDAMNITMKWDGYDIISMLSREISIS